MNRKKEFFWEECFYLFLLVVLPLIEIYQKRIQLSASTSALQFQMIGMMHLVSPLVFRFGYLFLVLRKVRTLQKSRLVLTIMLLVFLAVALWNVFFPLPVFVKISNPDQLPILLCNLVFYGYLLFQGWRERKRGLSE